MVGFGVNSFLRRIFSVGSPSANFLIRISFGISFQSGLLQWIFSVRSPSTDLFSRISFSGFFQSDLLRRIFLVRSPLVDLHCQISIGDLLCRISFDRSFQSDFFSTDLLSQISSNGSPQTDLLSRISYGRSSQSELFRRIFSVGSSPTDLLWRSSIQSPQLHRGTPRVSHCRRYWVGLSTLLYNKLGTYNLYAQVRGKVLRIIGYGEMLRIIRYS